MTDRVPGAPGQYKMTVSAEEAQKLLTGESVTVTLVRNDQPLVEGTPYNKASVLPDDLAAQICPNVTDPTPADALRNLLPKGGGTMTGAINMNSKGITNLPEPSAESDAATLKTVMTKGGGAKLLWTNSSPTSSFAAQSVSISDLSAYSLLYIEFAFGGSYSQYLFTSVMSNRSATFFVILPDIGSGLIGRTITPGNNKVEFGDAGTLSGTAQNTFLIPLRIYGIKTAG